MVVEVPAGRSLPLVLAGVVEVIMEREKRERERESARERVRERWEVLV